MSEPVWCRHGEAGAHWYGGEHTPSVSDVKHARIEDVGTWRKWCAGPPRSAMFEPWRQQLEWQMNLLPHPIDGVHRIDGTWEAWVDGKMVATGPTKEIIEAAYEHHKEALLPFPELIDIDASQVPDEVNIPGPLRHERLTSDELHVVQLLRDAVAERGEAISKKWGETLTLAMSVDDSLKNFTPLGWIGWGEVHWYADTPIYDQLCAETGLYPAGDATHHGVTSA